MKICSKCKLLKEDSDFNSKRTECKSCQSLYAKSYYNSHFEIRSIQKKLWKTNNPDKVKNYPHSQEKNKEYCSRRRARKRLAIGNFTAREWIELQKFYKNSCLCCGTLGNMTPDHVVPLSRGGSNSIDNIQPLCESCNHKKGTKTIDYRKVGALC